MSGSERRQTDQETRRVDHTDGKHLQSINMTNKRSAISWVVERVQCLESKAKNKEVRRTSGVYRARQLAEGQLSREENCYDKKPSLTETLHVILHLEALSAANRSTFGFEMTLETVQWRAWFVNPRAPR